MTNPAISTMTKEINELKNKFSEIKIKLINKIDSLSDVDQEVADIIETDYKNKSIVEENEE
jgi:hypothetical protein